MVQFHSHHKAIAAVFFIPYCCKNEMMKGIHQNVLKNDVKRNLVYLSSTHCIFRNRFGIPAQFKNDAHLDVWDPNHRMLRDGCAGIPNLSPFSTWFIRTFWYKCQVYFKTLRNNMASRILKENNKDMNFFIPKNPNSPHSIMQAENILKWKGIWNLSVFSLWWPSWNEVKSLELFSPRQR